MTIFILPSSPKLMPVHAKGLHQQGLSKELISQLKKMRNSVTTVHLQQLVVKSGELKNCFSFFTLKTTV